MTFVPTGNESQFPPTPSKRRGPSRERGEQLDRIHDGTGGELGGAEQQQPSPEDIVEGWPRADQL